MSNIQIPITANGTTVLATAGKYCAVNIDVNVEVPPDQIPAYNRYASIATALAGTTTVETGTVGAYTDESGGYHVILLDDMASASSISIAKDCTLHLNGHILSFTAETAYLDVNAASTVTIDGTVPGSEIKKEVASATSATCRLINLGSTQLTINGGTFTEKVAGGTKGVIPILIGTTSPGLVMDGCTVSVDSGTTGNTKCIEYDSPITLKNCTFTAIATGGATGKTVSCINMYADALMENCYMIAKSAVQGMNVRTVCNNGYNCTIKNCNIVADGYADVGTNAYSAVAVSSSNKLIIEGGTYRGAREALSVYDYARIDGGVYEGCQHGGGYMQGTDIRVKNATFRNIPYFGDCGWGDTRFGVCYCGASGVEVKTYFDNCQFEREAPSGGFGVVSKYTGTSVYLSNSEFGENISTDLRADAENYIYVGENVDYDTVYGDGTIDTETYAGQSFAW